MIWACHHTSGLQIRMSRILNQAIGISFLQISVKSLQESGYSMCTTSILVFIIHMRYYISRKWCSLWWQNLIGQCVVCALIVVLVLLCVMWIERSCLTFLCWKPVFTGDRLFMKFGRWRSSTAHRVVDATAAAMSEHAAPLYPISCQNPFVTHGRQLTAYSHSSSFQSLTTACTNLTLSNFSLQSYTTFFILSVINVRRRRN